jgi:ABC-2 type transport system ATP-binding protein
MNALEVTNVTIEYVQRKKIKRAVDHLSLEIREGELFGLLGPNGAGKTSLISCVTSLNHDFSGNISIFGHRCGSDAAKVLTGVVPQELVSYGYFSLEEVLMVQAGYFGVSHAKERIDYLLTKLQLVEQRKLKISQLSGGMKRRFLIAKALIHEPKLLLLDEPSAGVDVELRTLLWDFVKELNRSGTTILLTTHYLEEAERLCDRVAVIHHGKLLACDTTHSLINRLQGKRVLIRLSHPHEIAPPTDKDLFLDFGQQGNIVNVCISRDLKIPDLLKRLEISLDDVEDLQTQAGKLEDAFLKLIASGVSS